MRSCREGDLRRERGLRGRKTRGARLHLWAGQRRAIEHDASEKVGQRSPWLAKDVSGADQRCGGRGGERVAFESLDGA